MKCAFIFLAMIAVAKGIDFLNNRAPPGQPTTVLPKTNNKPDVGRKQQFEDLPDLIFDDSDEEYDEPPTPKG